MKDYIKLLDKSPILIKLIFALPIIDGIIWGLYRVFKGLVEKRVITFIIGIIWIFAGAAICWIIDIFTLVFAGKVFFD
ncbi:MAG: hypothetical protein WCR63_01850 [Bacilli bacterium]